MNLTQFKSLCLEHNLEVFIDESYYGILAVRKIGDRDFNKTMNFVSVEIALKYLQDNDWKVNYDKGS